ncbi:MAG: ABC transporter permease, partial [Verrucomicrobia bacterium]|nr:ABC transporter permease [Verrucomicrobiota bacterium]
MKVYFLRRLLLVPLTVLGVTFLVFAITRVMPGSPLAKELQAAAAGTTDGGGGSGKGGGG